MKLRSSIAAAGAAALIGTGALAVPALASAHPATHTLKFISVQKQSIPLSKTSGGQQDNDVNAKGKAVGFDTLYFAFSSASTATVYATFDAAGGFSTGPARAAGTRRSRGWSAPTAPPGRRRGRAAWPPA